LVLVSILIGFAYVSWWIVVAIHWQWWTTAFGLANTIIFNFIVLMIVVSWGRTIFSDPGYNSPGWVPNATQQEMEDAKKPAKKRIRFDFDSARWCPHCKEFKPPRTHHCRECNRCVKRMDHHCPWVNNCVGHNNHKYFILFVTYATIGMSYAIITIIASIVYDLRTSRKPGSISGLNLTLFILNLITTLPVCIAVGSLCYFQLSMLFRNLTSIENYNEKKHRKFVIQRLGIKNYRWPYSFHVLYNIKQVMGRNVFWWFFPVRTVENDGLEWKLSATYALEGEDKDLLNEDDEPREERIFIRENTQLTGRIMK
jgi:palmitoyltransferase